MQCKNKIVLMGDSGVGKTSIVRRWLTNSFGGDQAPTIGSAFLKTTFEYRGQEQVVQVWDTAGEERFRAMAPIYAQGAFAAVIVYDRSSRISFKNIDEWVSQLQCNYDIPILLCGNKSEIEKLDVTEDEGIEAAKKYQHCKYYSTSALTGSGIKEAFECILGEAFRMREFEQVNPTKKLDVITEQKSSCC